VHLLIVVQGQWGQRIAEHVSKTAPSAWQIWTWQGPQVLPLILDEPDEFLPDHLPQVDLLLVLTESAGMTDLAPDLAGLCQAQAVIVPVDRRSWAPPGLVRQVKKRLEAIGVGSALPTPFCSLAPSRGQHPLIQSFAHHYGRPQLVCAVENGAVVTCQVARGAPCGNTHYVAGRLAGVAVEEAAEQAGLLHHYYPCWGGMEADPVWGTHTLLHIAATMSQRAVERAVSDEPGSQQAE
jgi:hypothetical protein